MKTKLAGMGGAAPQTYVDDVFSTWLYTGNGSTQTITNGIDLSGQGGLVWVKNRSGANSHILWDTNRGIYNVLQTQNFNAQVYDNSTGFNFTSTGWGLNTIYGDYNNSGSNYASWTFRKAAKFFDVVTYTGDGSSHHSIPHSLGSVPGMIIVKRTDTTSNWAVYHTELGIGTIYLNTTAAYFVDTTIWDGSPSATTFSVNTNSIVNASGGTYVAYLFAHDTASDGIIQCGSFTTNGSGNATVNLGWEPQYIITKSLSTSENWFVIDTMRGWSVGGKESVLFPNLSSNEQTSTEYGNPTAIGFEVKQYIVGEPYIYMAIRRPNKPPTSGTQVFSPIAVNNLVNTINTTNFCVDLQWYGNRNGNIGNIITVDRLRGVATTGTQQQNYLKTSSTGAEINSGGSSYTNSWNNTGFKTSFAADGAQAVYWNFKRAPGFFDVVCYTGTGVATTQAHNLTVVPELIIVKSRSNIQDWHVYHKNNTASSTMYLQTNGAVNTNAAYVWDATRPTSTVFSVRADTGSNASGYTYVAYLFATLAGISKVGSYTGNGGTQNIDCGFAAGARFILIKRTDSTGDWYVWDTARGIVAANDPHLSLNTSAAEVTTDDSIDPLNAGFTVNQVAATNINVSSATYIFLAIA